MKSLSDPVVQKVRRVREKLAAKFGYDVRRIGADLQVRKKENPRLVERKGKKSVGRG